MASMHTRTFAINKPMAMVAALPAAAAGGDQLPNEAAAAGAAGAAEAGDAAADAGQGAAAEGRISQQQQQQRGRQGASQPLKPLNGNNQHSGTAAAAGTGNGNGPGSKPGGGNSTQPSYYRPEKLVRTDHRTQSIEGFLVTKASSAAVAATAAAAAAAGSTKRRRASAAAAGGGGGGPPGSMFSGAELEGQEGGLLGEGAAFSNASLHLQAAAAEEFAAAAELQAGGSGGLQQQQQQVLLRPVSQPRLPAVVTQLTSVRELLSEVQSAVHGELQELFKSHTWVGMVRSPCKPPLLAWLSSPCLTHLDSVVSCMTRGRFRAVRWLF